MIKPLTADERAVVRGQWALAASVAPWVTNTGDGTEHEVYEDSGHLHTVCYASDSDRAKLIASAPATIARLLATVDALRARLDSAVAHAAAAHGEDLADLLTRAYTAGEEAGAARERERYELWPGLQGYALEGCMSCPLGNFDEISESKPFGACTHGYTLCRPFTADEDKEDGAPGWCPLRNRPVLLELVTTPSPDTAPDAPRALNGKGETDG